MNKKLNYFLLITIAFGWQMRALAQDLHFSQYFNSPLLVNPANTGFIPEGDHRLGINYRNQWASIGNPYKTFSIFGDGQFFGERFENGWLGVGGALLRDVAGSGD
ncbi:MAG TPA: type IX secretion system membrane protein PorP/SprF, partial [Pedobacter sp.]